MPPRCTALLAALALAGGLGACGADDELSTDIPRTTPDLTIPTATTEVTPADTSTTDTTATTSTSTPPQSATPPAANGGAAAPAAPVAPPAAPPALTTGGAGSGGAAQPPATGGAQPADGDFQNFCRDNPGAGPPC